MLTNKMIDNRVRKIEDLEAMVKEMQAKIDALKDELKEDMDGKGVDAINTGNYRLYYREVVKPAFDTKKFKEDHNALYDAYLRDVVTRPFKKYAA